MSYSGPSTPDGQKRGAFWQTVTIVLAVTLILDVLKFKTLSREMVSDWLLQSAALSLGLWVGQALWRRYG